MATPKKYKTKKQKEKEAVEYFKYVLTQIPDPRRPQGIRYSMEAIVLIALMGMVAGADNAQQMEDWGEAHEEWLSEIVELPHGIPTQDVFLSVFATLAVDALLDVFLAWMKVIQIRLNQQGEKHIAIDGKTLRRSFDKSSGKPALHKVSAWASETGMVIGQVNTDAKSNEITAIPELLKIIDIRDCVLTIDSMGCQTKIAKAIKDGGGDYLLAVKGNQGTLHADIENTFAQIRAGVVEGGDTYEKHKVISEGHGRIETRITRVFRDISSLTTAASWEGLRFIVMVDTERTDFSTGKTTEATRYYIGSRPDMPIERIQRIIRSHWSIENNLHWVLDTAFREDELRHRAGNCAANFSTLRHFALNLIKNFPGRKVGVASLRKKAGWSNSLMIKILLSWKG